jgi:hypothetical protein
LSDVIQIVNYPRGEELVESHFAEVRVDPAFVQVLRRNEGLK